MRGSTRLLPLVGVSAAFIAAVPLGAAASSEPPAAPTGDPIVIGVASAQTGFFSIFDGPIAEAIQLAVDEQNAAGGVLGRPLEVVISDTKSDPEFLASAAIDVLDQGADFVVTMCDYNLGAPAAQEAIAAGKPTFSCAGSALFGPIGIGPLAFSVNASSTTQGSIGAMFAADQGWETAYVLGDTADDYTGSWCRAFAETFEDRGGEVIGEDVFVNGDTTIQPQVSSLAASGLEPDVIALCGYPPTGATAIAQLRAAGIETPIVSTAGFDGSSWLDAVPGVSDVYAVVDGSLYGDDPNPAVNDVLADYAETYGDPTTSYILYGTAIVQTIVTAIEAAGSTDGDAIVAALEGMGEFETVLGSMSYTSQCHSAISRSLKIVGYTDGEGHFVTTVAPPAEPLQPEGCAA